MLGKLSGYKIAFHIFLFVLLLPACSTRGFIREGASYKDFYQDLRECEEENTPQWTLCVGYACQQQQDEFKHRRNQCLMARGWQLSRDSKAFHP